MAEAGMSVMIYVVGPDMLVDCQVRFETGAFSGTQWTIEGALRWLKYQLEVHQSEVVLEVRGGKDIESGGEGIMAENVNEGFEDEDQYFEQYPISNGKPVESSKWVIASQSLAQERTWATECGMIFIKQDITNSHEVDENFNQEIAGLELGNDMGCLHFFLWSDPRS